MNTLSEHARLITENRKLEEEAARKAAEIEKARLRDEMIKEAQQWADEMFVSTNEKILAAANEGRNRTSVTVASLEDDYSIITRARGAALKRLLESEGFKVSVEVDETEPCGSDSIFNHTVYSTRLAIAW